MIHPSPELLAVSRRFFGKILAHDTADLHAFLTEDDRLRFVGSDAHEYWSGAVVRDGIGDFFAAIPPVVSFEEREAEAFENGSAGWCSFVFEVHFEGHAEPHIARETLVFALDGASWKIVQRHGSVPVSNQTSLGIEQSAIQKLVDAAAEGFALNQREGLASIMFTDVVSSSALAEVIGNAAWSARISTHFAMLRKVIEGAGGQFVKSLGDGTLSSFPSARSALEAAQTLQQRMAAQTEEPRLSIRIGLHTGDVVQTEDDFFGSVVNRAARITSIADPGEIAVSEATRAMIGTDSRFHFDAPTQETLKGFDGIHAIYRLALAP